MVGQGISQAPVNLAKPKIYRGVHLAPSRYPIYLVLFYAILVLFAWVTTCILTFRPVTINRYGVSKQDYHLNENLTLDGPGGPGEERKCHVHNAFNQNQNWYKTAQVIQSIVGVLTIPLTSTICSNAAVVYLQHSSGFRPPNLTLRQMSVLADKGWSDIWIFFKLFIGTRNRYISSFLLWAIFLHAIGALISPLQQVFLSTETIKTQKYPYIENTGLDIPEMKYSQVKYDHDETVAMVRKRLQDEGTDMSSTSWLGANSLKNAEFQDMASMSWLSWTYMARQPDYFQTQFPKSFHTGLVQQFAPRFNFTSRYEKISQEGFPLDCDNIPGSFSTKYEQSIVNNTGDPISWAVHACMPVDIGKSPWKSTRARQDFSEELYLNISISVYEEFYHSDSYGETRYTTRPQTPELYRVVVDTTAGYFELPNYMNGREPGPLLKDGPSEFCGDACLNQVNHGRDPL